MISCDGNGHMQQTHFEWFYILKQYDTCAVLNIGNFNFYTKIKFNLYQYTVVDLHT